MYFITDKITDLRSLTAKKIREIVEDEFEALAVNCGEIGPWQHANMNNNDCILCFSPQKMRFGIGDPGADDPRLEWLAGIDAGVGGGAGADAAEAAGLAEEDDDGFDALIEKLFQEKKEEKWVTVVTGGDDCCETFNWDDDWATAILAMVKKSIQQAKESA